MIPTVSAARDPESVSARSSAVAARQSLNELAKRSSSALAIRARLRSTSRARAPERADDGDGDDDGGGGDAPVGASWRSQSVWSSVVGTSSATGSRAEEDASHASRNRSVPLRRPVSGGDGDGDDDDDDDDDGAWSASCSRAAFARSVSCRSSASGHCRKGGGGKARKPEGRGEGTGAALRTVELLVGAAKPSYPNTLAAVTNSYTATPCRANVFFARKRAGK